MSYSRSLQISFQNSVILDTNKKSDTTLEAVQSYTFSSVFANTSPLFNRSVLEFISERVTISDSSFFTYITDSEFNTALYFPFSIGWITSYAHNDYALELEGQLRIFDPGVGKDVPLYLSMPPVISYVSTSVTTPKFRCVWDTTKDSSILGLLPFGLYANLELVFIPKQEWPLFHLVCYDDTYHNLLQVENVNPDNDIANWIQLLHNSPVKKQTRWSKWEYLVLPLPPRAEFLMANDVDGDYSYTVIFNSNFSSEEQFSLYKNALLAIVSQLVGKQYYSNDYKEYLDKNTCWGTERSNMYSLLDSFAILDVKTINETTVEFLGFGWYLDSTEIQSFEEFDYNQIFKFQNLAGKWNLYSYAPKIIFAGEGLPSYSTENTSSSIEEDFRYNMFLSIALAKYVYPELQKVFTGNKKIRTIQSVVLLQNYIRKLIEDHKATLKEDLQDGTLEVSTISLTNVVNFYLDEVLPDKLANAIRFGYDFQFGGYYYLWGNTMNTILMKEITESQPQNEADVEVQIVLNDDLTQERIGTKYIFVNSKSIETDGWHIYTSGGTAVLDGDITNSIYLLNIDRNYKLSFSIGERAQFKEIGLPLYSNLSTSFILKPGQTLRLFVPDYVYTGEYDGLVNIPPNKGHLFSILPLDAPVLVQIEDSNVKIQGNVSKAEVIIEFPAMYKENANIVLLGFDYIRAHIVHTIKNPSTDEEASNVIIPHIYANRVDFCLGKTEIPLCKGDKLNLGEPSLTSTLYETWKSKYYDLLLNKFELHTDDGWCTPITLDTGLLPYIAPNANINLLPQTVYVTENFPIFEK